MSIICNEKDAEIVKMRGDIKGLREALEAFLRAPCTGSAGPGSSTIVVQDFTLRAAKKALAVSTSADEEVQR